MSTLSPTGRGGSTLGELAESAVLARILPRMSAGDSAELGPGDDAAVVSAPDGRFVVTTDLMVHGPDFRLAWSTPHDLGWKAAASNLADVAAMGARPTALVVAIAAPPELDVSVLEGIADGLAAGCSVMAPGCGVVGGDLSVSATLTISITAFGSLDGREPVTRSGARTGDVVAVAGPMGRAGLGISLLFERATEQRDGADPEPSARLGRELRAAHPEIVDAQLAPVAAIAAGVAAGGAATAMMDVSDGLVLDARRLARASGRVIVLDAEAIDLLAAALLVVPGVDLERARRSVLFGGEDHAMLATFPSDIALPSGFVPIGVVEDAADVVSAGEAEGAAAGEVRLAGAALVERGGWDPYLQWDGSRG